jgi:hypothetical protein
VHLQRYPALFFILGDRDLNTTILAFDVPGLTVPERIAADGTTEIKRVMKAA